MGVPGTKSTSIGYGVCLLDDDVRAIASPRTRPRTRVMALIRSLPSWLPLFAVAVVLTVLAGCRSSQDAASVDPGETEQAPPVADVRQPTPTQAAAAAEGQLAIDAGDYNGAIEIFESLLDENPSLTVAYVGIGRAYQDQGNFARAEPAYERAARLEPRNFEAQYGHGEVLRALGKLREALRAFRKALTIDPNDVEALNAMGGTLVELGMPGSAIPAAEKAVELDPTNGRLRAALGTAFMLAKRYPEAIDEYEIAIELAGNDPEIITNLVECYAREERFREAVNAGEVLVNIAPSPMVWERLGRAYFKTGDFDASLESYRRALEIDPEYWPALNGVGVNELNAWLKSGRTEMAARVEAADAFRASVRINPDQPKVVKILTTYGI